MLTRLTLTTSMCILLICGSASAIPIYNSPAPLSGSRSVGGGLQTAEADWQDAIIEWLITDNGNNTFTYTYTLENFDKPGISHVTLDFSDDCIEGDQIADPNCLTDPKLNGTPISSSNIDPGDHDGVVGGIKFDIGGDGDLVYSFVSNRNPVFGDIHVKGGQSELTNVGLGDHFAPERVAADFIARPDGVAPEPATLAVICVGGAIALLRRRNRR